MGDDNGLVSNLEGILLPHSWICEADTTCDKISQRDLREVKNLYVLTMFSLHAWDIFISHTHEKNPSHICPYPIRSRKNILCPRPANFGYLGMMSIHSIIELLKTSGVAMIYPYLYNIHTGWWFQPLWKIWKSVRIIIPNIWKLKKCSEPPTSIYR